MNVNMLSVEMVGFRMGSIIWLNVWNFFVLFICVDLMILLGMLFFINCLIKNMLKVFVVVGKIMVV